MLIGWFVLLGCTQGVAEERALIEGGQLQGEVFEQHGIDPSVSRAAAMAFENARLQGETTSTVYTIIDMTQHSKEKRLWTIDVDKNEQLFHEHVAHGRMSDSNHDGMLDSVSNVPNSKQSSVGLYRTAEVYTGKHGRSLKLDGLEKGFNDNARDRAIVIHGAKYVGADFIKKHGKIGRSFGCPSVSLDMSDELISTIQEGSLVFIYADDASWLHTSAYLK